MTAAERLWKCLVDQGKSLTVEDLAEAEKPVERETADGEIVLVPRKQLVEVLSADIREVCGQPTTDPIIEGLRKGQRIFRDVPEQIVAIQTSCLLHLLDYRGFKPKADKPKPPQPAGTQP